MIDFDNVLTFPLEIREWVLVNKTWLFSVLDNQKFSTPWKLANKLRDIRLEENSFVKQYLLNNSNLEIAVWHATRIEDIESFKKKGVAVTHGEDSDFENHFTDLFKRIGLDSFQIENILSHIHFLWNRDKELRTQMIHFFIDKNFIYSDDQLNAFALNLGGECVRWAIEAIDKELYKVEPYKQLWIVGTPSIIKFRCKLKEMPFRTQHHIITEIFNYYIAKELYDFDYEFKLTGMKIGSVSSENIIAIEEIKGFISMQEKYEEFQHFYNA